MLLLSNDALWVLLLSDDALWVLLLSDDALWMLLLSDNALWVILFSDYALWVLLLSEDILLKLLLYDENLRLLLLSKYTFWMLVTFQTHFVIVTAGRYSFITDWKPSTQLSVTSNKTRHLIFFIPWLLNIEWEVNCLHLHNLLLTSIINSSLLTRLHASTVKQPSSGHSFLQNFESHCSYMAQCHGMEVSILIQKRIF
jgi:hypothetical protein